MNEKQYFYSGGTMRMGPFSFEALQKASIKPDTLILNNTLPDWVEARSLSEFQAFFANKNTIFQGYDMPPPIRQAPGSTYSNPRNSYNFRGNPYTYNSRNMPPMPETYMVWAILATIFGYLLLGIASIISASNVSTAYVAGAALSSAYAKKWTIWSAVSILIIAILYIFLILISLIA